MSHDWQLIVEESERAQVIQIRVIVLGGSLTDPPEFPGLTHLLGRVLLKGSRRSPGLQWLEKLESMGAAMDCSIEHTYLEFAAVVLSENIQEFLELWAEAWREPEFSIHEIETLRLQIESELIARDQDPRTLVATHVLQHLYRGTTAEHPAEGSILAFENAKASELQRLCLFQRNRLLVRGNICIGLVVPKGHSQSIQEMWERTFDFVSPGLTQQVELPEIDWHKVPREIWIEREELTTVPFFWILPGLGESDPWREELGLANYVFGGDFTSRLMKALRSDKGWTYSAYSGFSQLLNSDRNRGLFSLYAFPSHEFAELAIEESRRLLLEFIQNGITEEELVSAKKSLSNKFLFTMDTADKRLKLKLDERIDGRPMFTPMEFKKRIDSVSRLHLNKLIQEKLDPNRLILAGAGEGAFALRRS